MSSSSTPAIPLRLLGFVLALAVALSAPGAASAAALQPEAPGPQAPAPGGLASEVFAPGTFTSHVQEAAPALEPGSEALGAAAVGAATPAGQDDADAAPAVPGSLVVTTDGVGDEGLLAQLPAAVRAAVPASAAEQLAEGVTRLQVDPGEVEAVQAALADVPGVEAVEPEREWTFTRVPNDPDLVRQWSHDVSDARGAWAVTTGSAAAVIAVIDSGVDARHPDLSGRVAVQEVVVREGDRLVVRGAAAAGDNDGCGIGHGTMVAGVAAAAGDNGVGIAGVAWNATIVDVAVASAGSCAPTDAKVVAALGRIASGAYGRRVDVVNLSLGGVEPSGRCPAAVQRAIDQVRAQGTVVVAAAGNEGTLELSVPAACRGVIAVGATGRAGGVSGYSSMASYLDVAAPGGDSGGGRCEVGTCVLTTGRGGGYVLVQGTSFAAPYVAGVATLVRSLHPGLPPDQVEALLEITARHPAGVGAHDHRLGWGRVHAAAALRHLRDGAPIPAPREHPAVRVAAGSGATSPIQQAVAMSQAAFPAGRAAHAVIARDDDFADALAGSSLTYGGGPAGFRGPLLFARRTGALPAETAAELRRTLAPGRTVFLLGGTAALDARLEADIRALGLVPHRLSGQTREHTAVAVARALRTGLAALGITPNAAAIVATRSNWPDAVTAGSLASTFGLPVLLTARDGLHPATAAYLAELRAQPVPVRGVYVVGGAGVVSDAAAIAARDAARAPVQRLSGPARDATAVAVAQELRRQLDPAVPPYAIAVDVDRADGYAHVLSASALAGTTGSVFLPVRGPSAPQRLTDATAAAFCRSGAAGILAGGTDLLPAGLGAEVRDVLAGTSPRCR